MLVYSLFEHELPIENYLFCPISGCREKEVNQYSCSGYRHGVIITQENSVHVLKLL